MGCCLGELGLGQIRRKTTSQEREPLHGEIANDEEPHVPSVLKKVNNSCMLALGAPGSLRAGRDGVRLCRGNGWRFGRGSPSDNDAWRADGWQST
jgi:hypothetical protein